MPLPELNKNIQIEDLIDHYPFALRFLMEKKIRCIMCGEPVWGTLEDAAREKGFDDTEIQELCEELKQLANVHSDILKHD